MKKTEQLTTKKRLQNIVKTSFPQGMKTALWLLKLTIPVSFLVFLLDFFGFLNGIAGWVAPFFRLIGLSGQASIVLITSFFTNIYSVIAVMVTLGTGFREGTILAVMCLISHALIVETAIQRKTGSRAWQMVFIRLSASFIAAWALNLLLPGENALGTQQVVFQKKIFLPTLLNWLSGISLTSLKIVVLVNLLLILQKALNEFGLIKWILKPFEPLLWLMGLPKETGFLWMVAYTLGLSYGGAIMISQAEEGKLTRENADLLNHHIALSHSQLEDTLLFVSMGYPVLILVFPRIILAVIYVWIRRLTLDIRRKKRVETN